MTILVLAVVWLAATATQSVQFRRRLRRELERHYLSSKNAYREVRCCVRSSDGRLGSCGIGGWP